MNEALTAFMYYAGGWMVSTAAILWFINFLSRGLLINLVKAKGARGRKILLQIQTVSEGYWSIAWFDKQYGLRYKARDKSYRTIANYTKDDIRQFMTVPYMRIDESTDSITTLTIVRKGQEVKEDVRTVEPIKHAVLDVDKPGMSMKTADDLITDAYNRPSGNTDKLIIAAIIMLVLVLLLEVGILFIVYQVKQLIPLLAEEIAKKVPAVVTQ